MSNELTYRLYTPGDEEGIIKLLKLSFPRWERQKNAILNWKWKYIDPPNNSMIRVVLDGNNIVAVDHKKILNMKIGDAIYLAAYSDDVAVHSDYRSRGIYSEMLKLSLEYRKEHGISYSYYSTINPIVSTTDTKSGFKKFSFYISHLVKILKSDEYLKKKKRDNLVTKLGVKALTSYTELTHAFSSQPKQMSKYSIVEVPRFDDRIKEFWDKVKVGYNYIIEKTPDYLNWKIQNPSEKNSIRLAIEDDKVLGYIIFNTYNQDDQIDGKINDLLTIPDRFDVANELVKNACDTIENEGASAVYYPATKGHPYEELVKRQGFLDASMMKSSYFYYYIHNKIDEDYLEKLSPSNVQLQHF